MNVQIDFEISVHLVLQASGTLGYNMFGPVSRLIVSHLSKLTFFRRSPRYIIVLKK